MQTPVLAQVTTAQQYRALIVSTLSFTICFAAWTIFAIIGIQIKNELGLNETEFGLLVGTPILSGSLSRLFLGVWTDQYGGRIVNLIIMLIAAVSTWLLTQAATYHGYLLAALGLGLAGGSFTVGVAYVSRWFPKDKQGVSLGAFGMGNAGAALTKLVAPAIMVAYGWQAVAEYWAYALGATAIIQYLITEDDPVLRQRRGRGEKSMTMRQSLAPLKKLQVWRFSLYYFFVFGAFVALALWLPRYYVAVYGLDIKTAGALAAIFSIAASVFRAVGGWLSDKYGARRVMYWTFGMAVVCTFLLSYPPADYVVHSMRGDIRFNLTMGFIPFTFLTFLLGFFMSFGKAAVYKHIPVYYPQHVGPVAGIVGLVGGLGGFFLPIAFGYMNDLTGVWTSCFMLLFALVATALTWMHFAIQRLEYRKHPDILEDRFLPELDEAFYEKDTWNPEDETFWQKVGRRCANRNLWISVPCLLLSFATWMMWSVIAVNLNNVGFNFTKEQLFTLAAVPGLSGATLRIFYSFVVPIVGGRNWTVLSTASLLLPAIGIGIAVQDQTTSYATMLTLAALCGFGGGNFSSSMSNISFFFPRRKQGLALGINAGLGNLGVSVLQYFTPIVTGIALFGDMGGDGQILTSGAKAGQMIWLQNAAYVWVPLIIAATLAAFFGMDNLKTAQVPLREQLVIFKRKHMYLTTWLYVMSFGSFIGFSAAFPLLIKTQFPDINPLDYAFIGPLLGAMVRPVGGWVADKLGGARVTFWNLFVMIAATASVLYFIQPENKAFWGFFASFLVLFTTTGVANGSVFRMIGVIFPPREKAPVLGFSAAIAAFGAFFIPKIFGFVIEKNGSADLAFHIFIGYYVTCLVLTWWFYYRRNAATPC